MRIKNFKIPSCINQWNIIYDQNNFLSKEDWLVTSIKTEDILQLKHISNGLALDVGFYEKTYKIYVIQNNNWDAPKEIFESPEVQFIETKLYMLIEKYIK